MSEWREMTLGKIAEIQTGPFGSQLHQYDYVQVGTPIITVEHLINDRIEHAPDIPKVSDNDRDRLIKYTLQEGDIVFSRVGAVDRCGYVSEQENGWMFSGRLLRVRPDRNLVAPQYLYFCVAQNSTKDFIRKIAVGTTMPSLNTSLLSQIPITLPPLPEQRRIAAVLSTLDAKIDLLRRQNATLEAIAQALFERWFVDFEFPFDANSASSLAQGKPNAHGQPYKSAGGPMQPSELGEIPVGWRVGSFLDLFDLLSGGTPKTSIQEYWDGTIKWISGKDVTANHRGFILDTEKQITEEGLNNSATKLLPKFTTIISARGTVGCYCLLSEAMCMSQTNYGIKAKDSDINFFTYLSVSHIVARLKAQAYGSVFDTITTATFQQSENVIPPQAVVLEFESCVIPIFHKMLTNEHQICTLTRLRDTLLPRLMSGRLRVQA